VVMLQVHLSRSQPCRVVQLHLVTIGPGVIQGPVTSVLKRLRRGLLAGMVLSLVLALCPCLVCAQMAADDCCASDGLSIGGLCCASASGSRTVAPSATVLAVASGPAPAHPMTNDAAVLVSVFSHPLPTRPTVARAVLRI